jgi:hypothetical protein
MVETKIKLNTTKDVASFVALCSNCVDDVWVYSEKYIVSGKSLTELNVLNLSDTLKVEFCGDIPEEVKTGMKKFIVD